MVMAGHTFYLDKLEQAVNQYFLQILSLVPDTDSAEGRRITVKTFLDQFPRKYGTGP